MKTSWMDPTGTAAAATAKPLNSIIVLPRISLPEAQRNLKTSRFEKHRVYHCLAGGTNKRIRHCFETYCCYRLAASAKQ